MKKNGVIVPEALNRQLESFIDDLSRFNKKRSNPRPDKDYIFLTDFYHRLFRDRNQRALEVISERYLRVKKLANEQFPATTLWNLCMDGRVLAVLVNGASAGVGSSIRVPGGILRDFVYGKDGKLKLLDKSNFAFIMKRALGKFETDTIFEIYDSHVGCAARKGEEMSHGAIPNDAGLLSDVLYKKQMAEATVQFVKENFARNITIIPIQISFDPHLGTLYMGLETEDALLYANKHGGEFTDEVLEALISEKKLVYTGTLVENKKLRTIFSNHTFILDWKKRYVDSAESFWTNLAQLKEKALPLILEELQAMYPNLTTTSMGRKELEERAVLLLTNAYSVFLHNETLPGSVHTKLHLYPYGDHREEGVKVYEGGYPPFEISMFVLFSLDVKNLPANIELAAGLVRNNRREKRVSDRSGVYRDPDEFAKAPVPVVVQEIIREEISEKEWESLCKLSWEDLPDNWDTMEEKFFFDYLQQKVAVSLAVANGINNLRKRMAVLFDPEQLTSSHLIEHHKVALPLIAGMNRYNYFLIPFVKHGF